MLEDLNQAIPASAPARAATLDQDVYPGIRLATRNRFLGEPARGLKTELTLLGQTTLEDPKRIKIVTSRHQQIIAAMAQGDAAHLETSLRHRPNGLGHKVINP